MRSGAATVAEYLKELPDERRTAISRVRAVIRKHLPKGFVEHMGYGMIGYVVPHRLYPAGYHCDPKQPVPFAALASQKNYMALYLMTAYQDPRLELWLRDQFQKRSKRLDMGKCCIRFRKLEDLPLDVVGKAIAWVPLAEYLEGYQNSLERLKARRKPA